MKLILPHLAIVGFACLTTSCKPVKTRSQQSSTQDGPPNIIYIMSDGHGYQAVSAYGYGLNETPNIDRIAKEGAIFTRACVNNSLCAPRRAVMLTGKHSLANGKRSEEQKSELQSLRLITYAVFCLQTKKQHQ